MPSAAFFYFAWNFPAFCALAPKAKPYAADVEEKVFNDQVSCVVRKAVNELPERQRKAVEEHYLSGQTYNEIADQLHCSCSYVGQLVKSGLRGMREGKHAPELRVMYGERNFYRGTGLATFKRTRYSSPEWEVARICISNKTAKSKKQEKYGGAYK